jgi:hypothetical protein
VRLLYNPDRNFAGVAKKMLGQMAARQLVEPEMRLMPDDNRVTLLGPRLFKNGDGGISTIHWITVSKINRVAGNPRHMQRFDRIV